MNAIAIQFSAVGGGRYDRQGFVPASSSGLYQPTSQDYVDRFYSLLRKWQSETFHVSSTPELVGHPSFLEIIAMGRKVIPLILGEVSHEPSLLIYALNKITGEVPYASSDRGNIKAMTNAWISWGQRNSL